MNRIVKSVLILITTLALFYVMACLFPSLLTLTMFFIPLIVIIAVCVLIGQHIGRKKKD